MSELTDDDRELLKTAAYGAVVLVSAADPGFVKMIRESFAASDVLVDSTGLVRAVLIEGPPPLLPQAPPDRLQDLVLPALTRSVELLRAKAPAEVDAYRATVLAAADRVARAVAGVHPAEAAMVARVRAALSGDR